MSSTPACNKNACSEACLTLARSRCGLTRHDRIDLAAIASEALRTHDRSGLESVVALEPAGICGDPALVERLAANLVSNAIRHNLPGGRIEVATRTQAGHAFLVVANSSPLIQNPRTQSGLESCVCNATATLWINREPSRVRA
jgi:signal transduction histidine kinase